MGDNMITFQLCLLTYIVPQRDVSDVIEHHDVSDVIEHHAVSDHAVLGHTTDYTPIV